MNERTLSLKRYAPAGKSFDARVLGNMDVWEVRRADSAE